MHLVQIKGSNGSGKTTIVKDLLALDGYGGYPYLEWNDGVIYATVNPNVGWAAVGPYWREKKMGGCDKLKTVAQIKRAITDTVSWACEHSGLMVGVVFEGMMISTIKTTFYHFLLELERDGLYSIQPMFVILDAPAAGCVARIDARGTRRSIMDPAKVASKCALVMRHARTYDQRYVRYIDVDNTSRDCMVSEFLKAVGDTEMLEYVNADCGV